MIRVNHVSSRNENTFSRILLNNRQLDLAIFNLYVKMGILYDYTLIMKHVFCDVSSVVFFYYSLNPVAQRVAKTPLICKRVEPQV